MAERWAKQVGQEYHVNTPDKTAILLVGSAARQDVYNAHPITLQGQSIPSVLERKWAGIIWDSDLSFVAFLKAKIKAARVAFIPLCAIARERSAPLAEVREVVRSKVESSIFYGAMFLALVPTAAVVLEELQCDFERQLLGAPAWIPNTWLRAAAGWDLTWGERLVYEALVFRADLWSCESNMFVRKIWREAQNLKGKTFARASKLILEAVGLLEIYELPEWQQYVDTGRQCLNHYKAYLWKELTSRSHTNWRSLFKHSCRVHVHMLQQHTPISASARLLNADLLNYLYAADSWEKLRLGLVTSCISKPAVCKLCGRAGSLGHVLATCTQTSLRRVDLLCSVDPEWRYALYAALPGDWPGALLSPHLPLQRLAAAVVYCMHVVDLINKSKPECEEKLCL